jgi:hypothetical protein
MGVGALGTLSVGYYIPIPLTLPPTPGGYWLTLGTQFRPYTSDILTVTGLGGDYQSVLNDAVNIVLVPVTTLVLAQYYLLPALVVIGLAFLIPLGLIFRAFPFLRGIGGTLIAIGIGLSLIYPTILVLLNLPVLQVVASLQASAGGGSFSFWWISAIANYFGAAIGSLSSIYYGLNMIVVNVLFALSQFLLFALDLIIGYPITNGIAKALGGTIDLKVGGKLKIT